MIAGLRMVPLFLRRGNRGDDLTALVLTALGVAVAVALTLIALALRPGFDARDDRMAWREPTPAASGEATALQVRSTDWFQRKAIDRVDLAPAATSGTDRHTPADEAAHTDRTSASGQSDGTRASGQTGASGQVDQSAGPGSSREVERTRLSSQTGETGAWGPTGGTDRPGASSQASVSNQTDRPGQTSRSGVSGGLPVPPGLERFPRDGEVFVSPALRALLERDGSTGDALRARFPGAVVGTIGPEGLAHGDELVAVVGHGPGELVADPAGERVPLDLRGPDDPSAVTPIRGFARNGDDPALETYKVTASLGAVLLVVPALLLVGSAARLTAARRNQRLAVLRLAGATPGAVVAVTAAETAVAALAGAVLGLVLYGTFLPVVAHGATAGGPWALGDLWLGWPALLLTLVVAPALAAGCAAVALRRIVISPLGVAHRTGSRRPRPVRLLGMAAAWAALWLAARSIGGSDDALLPVMAGLGLVIASLALVGPWVTWVLGALLTRFARRPPTLLAGRRIVDDPKGAYRAISGVVLAGLTAGFLFTLGPVVESLGGRTSDDRDLIAQVDTPEPAALERALTADLATAGLHSTVHVDDLEDAGDAAGADSGTSGSSGDTEVRVTPAPGTDPEQVRTALAGDLGRTPLEATDDDVWGNNLVVHDFRRASLALALATMLLAATTTAIASSASILDQRTTLRRLRLAGTEIATLQRARAWQSALPLMAATLGSLATGVGTALLLLTAAGNAAARDIGPGDLAPMLAVVAAGLVLALGASTVTRPLLAATTAQD